LYCLLCGGRMKKANFKYKGIQLGTLYEDGRMEYVLKSSYADKMDIEIMAHTLEIMREVGLDEKFDFSTYVEAWNIFNNDSRFELVEDFDI